MAAVGSRPMSKNQKEKSIRRAVSALRLVCLLSATGLMIILLVVEDMNEFRSSFSVLTAGCIVFIYLEWFMSRKLCRMAEDLRSQQLRDGFIGSLVHEVRTPMTSLLLATRLLHRSFSDGFTTAQRNLLESSLRDVERLRCLIEELFLSISNNRIGTTDRVRGGGVWPR